MQTSKTEKATTQTKIFKCLKIGITNKLSPNLYCGSLNAPENCAKEFRRQMYNKSKYALKTANLR